MLAVIKGFGVAILGGLFGVGGEEMFIPLMVYGFGLSQHKAQGTSLALLLPPLGGFFLDRSAVTAENPAT
jgi:uncharacterized protein